MLGGCLEETKTKCINPPLVGGLVHFGELCISPLTLDYVIAAI